MLAANRPGKLTRADLEGRPQAELRAGDGHRPRLLLVELGPQRVVVKDYRGCGWLLRTLVGPWLIGREERIYRLLAGCPGVPQLIGRADRHALLVEHITGRNAQECPDGALPPEFFTRLELAVDAIHARGVVHCDLKNRRNIVVAEGYQPYIVDFTTALTRDGWPVLLRRPIYNRFLLDDQRAVVKARLQVGRLGSQADADFAYRRGGFERAVRRLRDGLRWVFRALSRG